MKLIHLNEQVNVKSCLSPAENTIVPSISFENDV